MSSFIKALLYLLCFINFSCAFSVPKSDSEVSSGANDGISSSAPKEITGRDDDSGLMKIFGGRSQNGNSELLVTVDVPDQLSKEVAYSRSQEELKKMQLSFLDKFVKECRTKSSHSDKIVVGRLALIFRIDATGIVRGIKSVSESTAKNSNHNAFKLFGNCVEDALVKKVY